jgi:hypothetical protein
MKAPGLRSAMDGDSCGVRSRSNDRAQRPVLVDPVGHRDAHLAVATLERVLHATRSS